jgi:hypothetical protein
MLNKSHNLIPIGALLVLICFFLPWVKATAVGFIGITVTGMKLGGLFWLIPILAGVILLLYGFGLSQKSLVMVKKVILICILTALAIFVTKMLTIVYGHQNFLTNLAMKTVKIAPRLGILGTLIGMILMWGGAVGIRDRCGEEEPTEPLDSSEEIL